MNDWGGIVVAIVSAAGFLGASLLTVAGNETAARFRPYAAPVAAGILLALAFGDVIPEAMEANLTAGILGLASAFTLLYLLETFASAPEHGDAHAPTSGAELGAMLAGLAVHNAADGFAIGVASRLAGGAASLLGAGVLIHQIPVGLSFAAVLIGLGRSRAEVVRASLLMAIVIPIATGITVLLPIGGDRSMGLLFGASAGLLLYIGAAHLLPEVHASRHNRGAALVFAGTLLLMTLVSVTLLG